MGKQLGLFPKPTNARRCEGCGATNVLGAKECLSCGAVFEDPAPSHVRISRGNPRAIRGRSLPVYRLGKGELERAREAHEAVDVERPRTRGECREGIRPCPFISCRHHLFVEVSPKTGALRFNFPDVPPDELEALPATCALDIADGGGETLERVGQLLNLTRERVRQLEQVVIAILRERMGRALSLEDES